jgi:hypothetical protein
METMKNSMKTDFENPSSAWPSTKGVQREKSKN